MTVHARSQSVEQQTIAQALQRLAARPEWLTAALQPDLVRQALVRHLPEVAGGRLRIVDCATPRLFLKQESGRWYGTFQLTVEGPDTPRQVVPIRITLTAPGLPLPGGAAQPTPQPFGTPGWQCDLPELRLHCELEPPEPPLQVLPQLTDPEAARALLEDSIRACSRTYPDIRIQSCRPELLNIKPGSRCTLRYDLDYAGADSGRDRPATVIAKTYQKGSGEQAYQGMVALWDSPLSRSTAVRISEPLAYLPELKLLIQAPLAEEQTLEELLRSVLRENTPAALARLEHFVRAAATGLAELHQSGARADETVTWDERITEIPELIERLSPVAPELTTSVTPLFDQLQALAAARPADSFVPSHGSFDSDQVLIAGDQISFIDFDSFCMAEPALDVAHFRAAIMDSGMKLIDEDTLCDEVACRSYLERLDALGMAFLAQYESLAPISRQRLALWEALDYLRDVLHLWKKPTPSGGTGVVRILEYHLRSMGLLA